jgi:hypothetical protein
MTWQQAEQLLDAATEGQRQTWELSRESLTEINPFGRNFAVSHFTLTVRAHNEVGRELAVRCLEIAAEDQLEQAVNSALDQLANWRLVPPAREPEDFTNAVIPF